MNSNIKKVLVVAAVCAIPLGVFAYDKYERHNDRGHDRDDCNKSSYHNGNNNHMGANHYFDNDDDDAFFFGNEFFVKNGANLIFDGKIEQKPKNGFNGIWKIGGKEVIVDDNTKIFVDNDSRVEKEADVLAKRENGKIKAIQLEID